MREKEISKNNIKQRNYNPKITSDFGEGNNDFFIERLPMRALNFSHTISNDFSGNKPHIHIGYFEIFIFIKGNAVYYFDGHKIHLTPGNLIIFPPESLHKTDVDTNVDYERVVIHFSESYLNKFSTEETDLYEALIDRSNKVYKLDNRILANIAYLVDKNMYNIEKDEIAQDIIIQSEFAILLSQL
ncbi:MAG: AraC family ligand binding domain-containing protein, partial [Butyrivibrio sp.]|nr:AraC family ligand binding domain-containing protein [Butyrivibrio sp.]